MWCVFNPPLTPPSRGRINPYVSGHACHVSGHILLRVGTYPPTCRDTSVTCRDTSSYVSGHVCHVLGHILLRVGTRLSRVGTHPPTCRDTSVTCRDTFFISVDTYCHKYKTPIRFKTLSALCK